MTHSSSDRAGLLFLRVWMEPGHTTRALRARITGKFAGSGPEVNIATAATVEDAVESVRSWLEGFVASRAEDNSRTRPANTPLTRE